MTDLKVMAQVKNPKHNCAIAEHHDYDDNGDTHFVTHTTFKTKKRTEFYISYDHDHSLIVPVQPSSPKSNILNKENSSVYMLSTTAMMSLLRSTLPHKFPKI